MIFYYIGCCALGFVAGFLVGGSASPVVQTALPLLFALLGGGAGILGLTADPNSQRSKQRFRIAGLAAVCLSVPFLFAAIYASLLRTGAGLQAFLPPFAPKETPALLSTDSLMNLGSDESLQVLLLDRNLRLAGVSPVSVQSTISFIVHNRIESIQSFISKRGEISDTAKKLLAQLKPKDENADNSDVEKLIMSLGLFIDVSDGKKGRPTADELEKVEEIEKNLSDNTMTSDTINLLKNDPGIAPLVSKLVSMISDAPTRDFLTDTTKTEITQAVGAANKSSATASDQLHLFPFAVQGEAPPGRT